MECSGTTKYAYNPSDDKVLERWLESPYMHYFTGEVYFQYELPWDPPSLTRWRNRLDETGAEELLAQAIEAAKTQKASRPRELRVVSIDVTMQKKNVAHPTESRFLQVARSKLAERTAEAGIKLRQRYARLDPRFHRHAGCYARARQYKRMRRNFLEGGLGDAMNPILAVAGFDIRIADAVTGGFLALDIIWRPAADGSS